MQWKKKIRHLVVVEHLTKKEACKRIEGETKAPASTVDRYTCPGTYKAPSEYKTYTYPKYCYPINQPYNTLYVRIKRNIDKILPKIFDNKPELSLEEITTSLNKLTGISMKEEVIERVLSKYENKPRGPPIVKTETGNYQLNPSFYNS